MDHLKEKIASLLAESPALTAREIAAQLKVDKQQVNMLLYGELKRRFHQDSEHRWCPIVKRSDKFMEEQLISMDSKERSCLYIRMYDPELMFRIKKAAANDMRSVSNWVRIQLAKAVGYEFKK